MKKPGYLFFCLLILGILICSDCTVKEKRSIRIGASRPLTGANAIFEQVAFGPIYKMWIEEVNADGGIYVKEFGKKLPVELILYDDKSDLTIMAKNLEKLMTVDKVDLMLPPATTAALFAAAPLFNKYKYILMGAEGGASKIEEMINELPYFFSLLSFSDHNQVPVLASVLARHGVKTAGIMFISDLHGIEYAGVALPQLMLQGIEVTNITSIPLGVTDVSPILKEMKAAKVDAFLAFTYPDQGFLAVRQAREIGFNPKVFLIGPGGSYSIFPELFGPLANGVMSFGAWNRKVSLAHKEFADKLRKRYGEQIIDWWGHNLFYAGLQFLQQAIEKSGTLNQEKLKDIFLKEKFDTVLGPTWFDKNHLLAEECHSGEVGQWQNGIFEVIGPEKKATAAMLYPKPDWPK